MADAAEILTPDDVLTVDEVAAILKLKPKSVYALVAEKKIPGVRRIGRRVRFYRPDLVAWLSGQNGAPRSKGAR